jgi:Spy/CpxP family protein refolding chaperone
MMKARMLTVFAGVGCLALFAPAAFAHECMSDMEGGSGPHGGLLRRLDLTAAQNKEVMRLREELRAKVSPIREQLATKHAELWTLWKAATPDRAAMLAKEGEMAPLRRQMREARIDFWLGLHHVLTPEQRAKLSEGKPHGMGRGMGGMHCPCP